MKEYRTDDLIVYWMPERCYHSRECLFGQPAVFNSKVRPWIDLSQAEPEDIIQTIDLCPSAALKYDLPEGSRVKAASAQGPGWIKTKPPASARAEIKVMLNGPLVINGNVQLFDPRGKLIETCNRVALCRCGHTERRPYCDGSHLRHNWVGDC